MTLNKGRPTPPTSPQAAARALRTSDREPPVGSAAIVFGCAGPRLTEDERAFFAETRPIGFILFARNIETPGQTRALVEALRDSVGWRAPVMIDQEGGRVARMRPPHWRAHPPVAALTDRVDRVGASAWSEETLWEALALRGRLIAADLAAVDIDVVCAPVVDLAVSGADKVIGDRALGANPSLVAGRAAVLAAGLEAGGVTPMIKHVPGHGRATVDSHAALPTVAASRAELSADFAPFRALRDLPTAMTAHIRYEALDPTAPATLSPIVIDQVIRGEIGFEGLLISDDLGMGALAGPLADRAEAALTAGCDLALECSGDLDKMRRIISGVRALAGPALTRLDAALARRLPAEPADLDAARARLSALEGEALLDPAA